MFLRRRMGVDDIHVSFNNTETENLNNDTAHLGYTNNTSDGGTPGIHIFMDPLPNHSFLWKVGIIFAVTGIIILTSFIAMYGVNYTRRHRVFRRHRRRQQQQMLAFENQLSVTQDELVEGSCHHDTDHVTVHQSCTNSSRRWSRDDSTQPRSRSNSRSRSLSPGSGSRPRSPVTRQPVRRPNNDLEDDAAVHTGLENVRLAFKEDTPRYDSTVQRVDDLGV